MPERVLELLCATWAPKGHSWSVEAICVGQAVLGSGTPVRLHVLSSYGLCRVPRAAAGDTELISLLLLRGVLGDVAAAAEKSRDWA